MSLQPECSDHTSDAESVKTGDITGCGDQIQNNWRSAESMTAQKVLVNCSCYYKNLSVVQEGSLAEDRTLKTQARRARCSFTEKTQIHPGTIDVTRVTP